MWNIKSQSSEKDSQVEKTEKKETMQNIIFRDEKIIYERQKKVIYLYKTVCLPVCVIDL